MPVATAVATPAMAATPVPELTRSVATIPPVTDDSSRFAPREMSNSAAPSSIAMAVASSRPCVPSAARLRKLGRRQKVWFVDTSANTMMSRMSTAKIHTAVDRSTIAVRLRGRTDADSEMSLPTT